MAQSIHKLNLQIMQIKSHVGDENTLPVHFLGRVVLGRTGNFPNCMPIACCHGDNVVVARAGVLQ